MARQDQQAANAYRVAAVSPQAEVRLRLAGVQAQEQSHGDGLFGCFVQYAMRSSGWAAGLCTVSAY